MLDHMWIVLVLIRIETRMIMKKDDDSGGDDDDATGAGGVGQKNLEDNTCNSTDNYISFTFIYCTYIDVFHRFFLFV